MATLLVLRVTATLTSSWYVSQKLAASILRTDRWSGGTRILESIDAKRWESLVGSAKRWNENGSAVDACSEAAARTGKAQRCVIRVDQPGTQRARSPSDLMDEDGPMTITPHFISGLPRSGSTLLSAILKQNPRFQAGVTSPMTSLWASLLPAMSGKSEFSVFFDDERRARILASVFEAYYGEQEPDRVIFDTNRSWTGRAALTAKVYPASKIICCVRDVGWIIDSVERMLRRNPLQLSRVFMFKPGSSIYERSEILMNSEKGLIGLAWSSMREAWFGENADRIILVRYESLARHPGLTIQKLYDFLDEPYYRHDFERVEYDDVAYDAELGMPGMHKIRERVEYVERDPCIPPDIFSRYADASFWNNPRLNKRGLDVL